jgi:hypothetical protein
MEAKRPRNLYADSFIDGYAKRYGMPYVSESADWVQLDRLLKSEIGARLTLEVWTRGVANYFLSEVGGGHTLKHLCSRFVPYWRGPMNKYGQPERGRAFARVGSEKYASTNWVIRFLRKVNEANLPEEKREQLWALMDAAEGEQISEADALRRLEMIRSEGVEQKQMVG